MLFFISLVVVCYGFLVPIALYLSFRMRPLYEEVGVKHPLGLHLWIALIPAVGALFLLYLLRIEAQNYQLWKECEALEEYRRTKENK